jgi:hypothetical protein
MDSMNFVRRSPAPDGIHDTVYFNEYHNAKWWTERALRRHLVRKIADRLAPLAVVALIVAAFAAVSILESYL